jgi:hypothetical protein
VSRSTLLLEKGIEDDIERNLDRLKFELRMGTARRHLDVLMEYLQRLVRSLPATALRAAYEQKLTIAERMVATRHNLRLVKTQGHADNE